MQYTSRLAGLLTRAKGAASALALLPQAAAAGPQAGQQGAAVWPATAALLRPLLQVGWRSGKDVVQSCCVDAVRPFVCLSSTVPPNLWHRCMQHANDSPYCAFFLLSDVALVYTVRHAAIALAQAEVCALEQALAGAGEASSGTGVQQQLQQRVCGRLGVLCGLAVTAEDVRDGAVGRRVAKLGKHPDGVVAEAARRVVEEWKRRIPEKGAS